MVNSVVGSKYARPFVCHTGRKGKRQVLLVGRQVEYTAETKRQVRSRKNTAAAAMASPVVTLKASRLGLVGLCENGSTGPSASPTIRCSGRHPSSAEWRRAGATGSTPTLLNVELRSFSRRRLIEIASAWGSVDSGSRMVRELRSRLRERGTGVASLVTDAVDCRDARDYKEDCTE